MSDCGLKDKSLQTQKPDFISHKKVGLYLASRHWHSLKIRFDFSLEGWIVRMSDKLLAWFSDGVYWYLILDGLL